MVAFASYLMDVRTRLPVRGLRSDPDLVVEYVTPPYTPQPLPHAAPKVLVMQRPGDDALEEGLGRLAYAVARGWLLVMEYDDHPALVAEVKPRPFDPAEMDRFGLVHAVQTTTEPLAEAFRPHNPEVKIFENAVFELAPFPQGPPSRRVFYGAISRGGFGVEVARVLAPVVAEFPDLEFVVLGDAAVFEALPTANKVFEDYLPYEAYLARMAGCAVSLSPIEALPLRETKSDAKFLDAARAGVVTIASPLIYDRTIRHGVNGLLARKLEDWPALLRQALADPAQTRAIGRNAWDYVRTQRMFARQVPERAAWYRDLWARREALNAAALARVPGLAEAVALQTAQLRLQAAP
ncbi:glycosyltransferase [Phenylobacterium sp. LjRoot225]|uniref:glycosyltransferase family protein n=1 Tax=Phenylobacterium sp. LjRoot225 TaxID=3342285 RepID=UPI003ECE4172